MTTSISPFHVKILPPLKTHWDGFMKAQITNHKSQILIEGMFINDEYLLSC